MIKVIMIPNIFINMEPKTPKILAHNTPENLSLQSININKFIFRSIRTPSSPPKHLLFHRPTHLKTNT